MNDYGLMTPDEIFHLKNSIEDFEPHEIDDDMLARFYPEYKKHLALVPFFSSHGASTTLEWLVDGFLPKRGIGWMYGLPGSYKSFLALDLALSVANGKDWAGRPVQQGLVVYWASEGADGVRERRKAWEQHHKASAPMLMFDRTGNLAAEGGGRAFFQMAEQITAAFGKQKVALVVVDTYGQTSADDTKETVSAYVAALRNGIRVLGGDAAVLVVDHTTKTGDAYSGSVAKMGASDMMCRVRAKGDTTTVTMRGGRGKLKDGPPIDDIHFKMTPVESGRHAPSLIPVKVDAPPKAPAVEAETKAEQAQEEAPKKLTSGELLAMLMAETGHKLGSDELRAAFFAHPQNAGAKGATLRVRYHDAKKHLTRAV